MSTTERYMQAMQQSFRPDQAKGLNVTYQLQVTGAGTWTISVANQQCQIKPGAPPRADTSITMSGESYLKLAAGQLNVVAAYQQKQVQVGGNLQLAQKFAELFSPWAARAQGQPAPPQPAPTPPPVTPPQPSTPPPATLPQPPSSPPATPPQQPPAPQPQPPSPPPAPAGQVYPQLMNGSFDDYQPYIRDGEEKDWNGFPERYGANWTLQVISEARKRMRIMDSKTFADFAQKYFHGNGHDYHIHGRHSQVITGRYGFDMVLYQTVAAQPGREYTFTGGIVTFYKGPSPPAVDNKIFKRIGIDPTGGQNYSAPTVVWSPRDGQDNRWCYPSLKVKAQGNAITVFIRIENTEADVGKTDLNTIHLDNFTLG